MVTINNIEKKTENLLNRDLLLIDVAFEKSTPSRSEILEAIASHLKVEKDLLVINKISSIFGKRKGRVTCYLYNDKEVLAKVTNKHLLNRGVKKEE